jgi:hypothetical protein
MQATFPVRRWSVQPLLIALAVAAALICSAAGGYWLRSLTSQAAAATVTIARQSTATGSSQGLFGSENPLAASGRASDAIPTVREPAGHGGRVLY